MGKSHRDNHITRLKRGEIDFDKKEHRQNYREVCCSICGTPSKPQNLYNGICPTCYYDEEWEDGYN